MNINGYLCENTLVEEETPEETVEPPPYGLNSLSECSDSTTEFVEKVGALELDNYNSGLTTESTCSSPTFNAINWPL